MIRRNGAAGGKMLWLDPIRCGCDAAGSFLVGTWLSLVEHSLGVRGVGSSNLPVPTNLHPLFVRFFLLPSFSPLPPISLIVTLSSDSTAFRVACCRTWL